MDTCLLPVSQLVVGGDHIPGMDLVHVLRLTLGAHTDDRPLEVEAIPDTDLWLIRNGRHRYISALLAGTPHLLCQVSATA